MTHPAGLGKTHGTAETGENTKSPPEDLVGEREGDKSP